MSRINDQGGYSMGNVFIQLCTHNMSQAKVGTVVSDENVAKMVQGRKELCEDPIRYAQWRNNLKISRSKQVRKKK